MTNINLNILLIHIFIIINIFGKIDSGMYIVIYTDIGNILY